MSVSTFIKRPEVIEQLKLIIPKTPSRITAPLRASPITRNYQLVGTAYDYALRFELKRRFPHAVTKQWVAESAVNVLPDAAKQMRLCGHPKAPLNETENMLQRKAENVLKVAKDDFSSYITNENVGIDQQRIIIADALRLAKLDLIFRPGYIDDTCNSVDNIDDGDIDDIEKLLSITPYDDLAHPTIMKLNPTFGKYSTLMGGADADVISGEMLIDVKTTKNDKIENTALYQLISYMILARGLHKIDNNFPEIHTLALYFSRHGYLWKLPASSILSQSNYNSVEQWYLDHAKTVFKGVPI